MGGGGEERELPLTLIDDLANVKAINKERCYKINKCNSSDGHNNTGSHVSCCCLGFLEWRPPDCMCAGRQAGPIASPDRHRESE